MSRHPAITQFHKSKILNDKYLLGDEIGKGAYGRVYKGVDLENGDFVAIKQVSLENIPPEDLASIMQEIDLLKNLNHKNIVKYQGSFKAKTHLYIILEYVENGSLASIVKPNKFGALTESLVAYYIAQVLEGLAYLHEQGVIHRDIKGANLLITKESFVKLADFGVATKLTEADINTHSVVGTPYWMAPEVIEMSGVSASSDIWSVGCTVIELLTCVPPYYDLQPMPALFRIVQDDRPPIPEHLSAGLTDFLHQCFQKDAKLRPDAKTLLKHSWIRNSQPVRSTGPMSNIPPAILERLEDNQMDDKSLSQDQAQDDDAKSRPTTTTSETNGTNGHIVEEDVPNGDLPISIPSPPEETITNSTADSNVPSTVEDASSIPLEPQRHSDAGEQITESLTPDRLKSPPVEVEEDIQHEHVEAAEHTQPVKVPAPVFHELSKFTDTAADGMLDDLFDISAKLEEESTPNRNTALAKKLHEKMAQNREKKTGEGLLLFVGGEEFDSHGLEGGKDYILKQSVEVRRLFGLLKPQESEDVIISTCQKLVYIFREFPEQKSHIVAQHGVMPLLEMLEINNNRISHAVLQLVNQIVRDNTDIQENACLVGLVPLVMNFAAPERSKEIRMQAALFVQQMCSSTLTLQMFIACRGLPVLVGFLEPDYSKYREMVHLSIDCMWQIFELKSPTPRNDFCRIFAKSGVLVRLVNTMHSLNEASSEHRSRSAPLDPARVLAGHLDHQRPRSGQLDSLRVRYANEQPGTPDFPKFQQPKWQLPNQSEASSYPDRKPVSLPGHIRKRSVSQEKVLLQIPERVEKASQTGEVKNKADENYEDSHKSIGPEEQLPPLLTMIEKEVSGQFNYPRPVPEKTESYLPLLHHSNATRKANGDLETLITAVKDRGDMHSIRALVQGSSSKALNGASSSNGLTTIEATTSTSGLVSQSASGLLSLSGVLNGRPGSAASSGALTRLSSTFNADVAKEYLIKVAELLLEFSRADTTVKSSMCSLSLLLRLLTMLKKLEAPVLLKVLKCINELSKDPNTLDHLQRAEAIKHLVPLFDERQDTQFAPRIHNQVLNALYNLCKINKRRQEQAADAGIIPHLMNFITTNSPLKEVALPLLCDMAHASRHTREKLRMHKGLDVYLSLLDDHLWAVTALDSLAVCLAHDNEQRKVEQALLKKESVLKLVAFFQSCSGTSFVHILEPFLKIITKSPRLNTALAVSGLTQFLVGRLDHQDAIARLNLLKLIKAVYEHHPRPKQLIVEHDLPSKLQKLIEERRDGERTGSTGGQVLVKQMATALLKALHINTVL